MRVVLADDSVLLREGLARLLTEAGFEVIGQAADAGNLLALIAADPPDVAVVDIRMPPGPDGGIRAARTIRDRHPGVGVLVLSQYARPSYAFALLAEGADGAGYLLKDRVGDLAELTEALERVGRGGSVLDSAVVAQLVGRPRPAVSPMSKLTAREREVLALMAEGRSNQAISERLVVTGRTVEKHVNAILGKLSIRADPSDHRRVLAVLAYLRTP